MKNLTILILISGTLLSCKPVKDESNSLANSYRTSQTQGESKLPFFQSSEVRRHLVALRNKSRLTYLNQFFDLNYLGLTNDGLLEARKRTKLKDRNNVRKFIISDNKTRLAFFSAIDKASFTPNVLKLIQSAYAAHWKATAQAGWLVQQESGKWVEKTGTVGTHINENNIPISIKSQSTTRILKAQKTRFPSLKPLLDAGSIGLNRQGLLEARGGFNPNDKQMEDENRDRIDLFSSIAEESKIPEFSILVQIYFAESWYRQGQAQWWYQSKGGDWTQNNSL